MTDYQQCPTLPTFTSKPTSSTTAAFQVGIRKTTSNIIIYHPFSYIPFVYVFIFQLQLCSVLFCISFRFIP